MSIFRHIELNSPVVDHQIAGTSWPFLLCLHRHVPAAATNAALLAQVKSHRIENALVGQADTATAAAVVAILITVSSLTVEAVMVAGCEA